MAASSRDLDITVFGASGFVGRLVARYLARHERTARVGLAGRSQQRLAAVRDGLGPSAAAWPLLVADADDPPSLAAMAARTRVLATTVGPYARFGSGVVEACAHAGTDYLDLSGEVLFVRESIDRFSGVAAANGARIVHACGFDSIPSDLGVFAVASRARADGQGGLTDTTLVLKAARGGLSGGTVDSLRTQVDALRGQPCLRRVAADPYALSPDRGAEPDHGGERDLVGVRPDHDLGMWTGPFVMAPYNTRIVRRSNALQEWSYGRRLRYREVVGFGSGPLAPVLAGAVTAGLAGLSTAMALPPSRALLDRLLPAPGEGPGPGARRRGFFRFDLHASTERGARYLARISMDGDPGYAATSVMMGESARCLAHDRDRLPQRSGSLTPATAMGEALIDRLRAAGMRISLEPV